jgi:hypothetical protein
MNTTLIVGKQVPVFDEALVIAMGLKTAAEKAVRNEHMLIGIRNEEKEIYRVIGVTGPDNFLDAIALLAALGFRDELENKNFMRDGYDAVFSKRQAS